MAELVRSVNSLLRQDAAGVRPENSVIKPGFSWRSTVLHELTHALVQLSGVDFQHTDASVSGIPRTAWLTAERNKVLGLKPPVPVHCSNRHTAKRDNPSISPKVVLHAA